MSELVIKDVSFSYLNGFSLQHINVAVKRGEMVALIGPNGSGKTTLLKLTAGVLTPGCGEVLLDGASLKNLSRKGIAQRIAVMPQYFHMPFAFTVGEVVMLGRTPFIRALSGETERDLTRAQYTMGLVGIESSLGLSPLSEGFLVALAVGFRLAVREVVVFALVSLPPAFGGLQPSQFQLLASHALSLRQTGAAACG